MLYSFEVEIPIIYNSHEINYTKPEFGDKYKLERIIYDYALVPCTFRDIRDNIDYSVDEKIGIVMNAGRDRDFCVCFLSGIVADKHRNAGRIANTVIYNICRGLTFLINKKNSNKQEMRGLTPLRECYRCYENVTRKDWEMLLTK